MQVEAGAGFGDRLVWWYQTMNDSDLVRRLLRHVNHPNYRPVKPRVISRQLKLTAEQQTKLKQVIKHLVKEGKLGYGANHLVTARADTARNEIVGTFRRAMSGYGFVRPEGVRKEVGRDEDVFIAATKTKDAATGDTVRVRTSRRRTREGGSRLSGEIIDIVQRGKAQFVGTYESHEGEGLVRIDGTDFREPVLVGDPGAKNVQPGDKVVLELIRYPSANHPGEGVITEVLGPRGQPGVDTLTVLREFSLPERFPEDVLQAARDEAARFDGTLGLERRDLTDLVVITIDPVDARDFDDAISLEQLDNGHWRLGVHIADVSHFVRPKSPLDREARDRATSVYLPDRVIPMLPEVISNHLASLQPNQVRFTRSAFIEYTQEGVRIATDFCTGAIRSRRRFSYEEVDEFLADRAGWSIKLGREVYRLLDDMHRLAMILRKRRLHRGSIELTLPEIKIDLDRDGRVCGAHRVEYTESHQVIEEFMLAANEAVAERLRDLGILFLSRIHASPDPMKLQTLTEFVRELGIDCESLESRFEIKRVLHLVEGTPIEAAVNYAVLRSMQKAVYGPQDIGHYALATSNYCHFTSPIRRYPDLTIHRLMDATLHGQTPAGNFDQLAGLGEHCSQREQRAEAAERELTKLKLLHFLEDKIGQPLDVVITGVEEFGLFAQGIHLPAEGLIHINSLDDDHYHYDRQTHALIGHQVDHTYRLGDLLRVVIAAVDLDRRELDFEIRERLRPDSVLSDPFKLTATSAKAPSAKRPATAGRKRADASRRGRAKGGGKGSQRRPRRSK
jgi:ribonuclease R